MAELPVLSDAARSVLPQCVADLITTPPGMGNWVPTVHHNAFLGAVFDARFRGAGGMPAFERAAFEKSRKLWAGPLYRAIFAVVNPERFIRATERRWGMFHRGTALTLHRNEPGHVELWLKSPAHLFYEIPLRSMGRSVCAAVTAAGAKNTVLHVEEKSPSFAQVVIDWQ